MKGNVFVPQSQVAPGTYLASLEKVLAFTATKYKSTELEPILTFVWNLGDDNDGRPVRLSDRFVRIPLDHDGTPTLHDGSKLYNRLSACYGSRFTVSRGLNWTA